jgi:hypothetical protein
MNDSYGTVKARNASSLTVYNMRLKAQLINFYYSSPGTSIRQGFYT